jgi:hypothetical protein
MPSQTTIPASTLIPRRGFSRDRRRRAPVERARPGYSSRHDGRGGHDRRWLYDKLKPFKERVAEDIRDN